MHWADGSNGAGWVYLQPSYSIAQRYDVVQSNELRCIAFMSILNIYFSEHAASAQVENP